MHRVLIVCCLLLLAACSAPELQNRFDDLPVGDPFSGEKLFLQANGEAPACAACHMEDSTTELAPNLIGFGERAGSQVEGESAEVYAFNSILRPASFIVSGYSNTMFLNYDSHLEAADVADLIAYILAL